MKIDEVKRLLEAQQADEVVFRGSCHDCGVPLEVHCVIEEGRLAIEGGAVYNPKDGVTAEERIFLKCNECYAKDKVLRNFQECEIFSRVVGYLRPISGWNRGKAEEFKQRKVFKI